MDGESTLPLVRERSMRGMPLPRALSVSLDRCVRAFRSPQQSTQRIGFLGINSPVWFLSPFLCASHGRCSPLRAAVEREWGRERPLCVISKTMTVHFFKSWGRGADQLARPARTRCEGIGRFGFFGPPKKERIWLGPVLARPSHHEYGQDAFTMCWRAALAQAPPPSLSPSRSCPSRTARTRFAAKQLLPPC